MSNRQYCNYCHRTGVRRGRTYCDECAPKVTLLNRAELVAGLLFAAGVFAIFGAVKMLRRINE